MPRNHRQLYGRTSTIALILSVTEAYVCPGARIGTSRRVCRLVQDRCDSSRALASISGLGLRSLARYVVRGRVFSSSRRA